MYKTPKLKKLKHFPWIEDIDGLKAYCKKIAEGSENAQKEGCEVFILPGNLHDICIKYTGGDVFHLAEIMATWFKEHKHEAVIILKQYRDTTSPSFWTTILNVYRSPASVATDLWEGYVREEEGEAVRILDMYDTSKEEWITKEAYNRTGVMKIRGGFTTQQAHNKGA